MPLFQSSVVTKYLKAQNQSILSNNWLAFKKHFHNRQVQENIRRSKEEQYQGEFLIDLFVNVLGYTKNPSPNFNLTTEYKNVKDSKKADGAIIIDGIVKAVIELKGTNTTDLNKIEGQAFGYKNNQPECTYVITSNFEKLRLYIDNSIEHIEFNLFSLTEQNFGILYLCLASDSISQGLPKKLKDESVSQEKDITKKLYSDYSLFKRELHQNLVSYNPDIDELTLFKKSQKLLDRFLFLFFAEDRQLLPPNSVRLILNDWRDLQERDEDVRLYSRFKKYFEYLNSGFKGKRYDVFAYNGGLFKADEVLDVIAIDDELLYKHTLKLSQYDFQSEIDVNILGHIFENSLNELDEIKGQIEGHAVEKSNTKRKKDGVFYTPKYITKYIVDNTIGKLCKEKKDQINIVEEEFISNIKRQAKTKLMLVDKLNEYRSWLLQLTICDPACGSGAFLNQALDFLITEHAYVDELQAKLFGDALILTDIEKSILENNLFGVDLNEESVEIAKLSLWLRTARPNRKLNNLNDNIKCGNSLVEDRGIAGEQAFDWKQAFPQIYDKGGFDVIIGNPPWGAKLGDSAANYLLKAYPLVPSKLKDTYLYFILLSINNLKENGVLGFIVPNTWLLINNTSDLRKHLLQYNILQIVDHGDNVFEDAIVESSTLILKKEFSGSGGVLAVKQRGGVDLVNHVVDKSIWLNDKLHRIVLELNLTNHGLIRRLENISEPFEHSSEIIFGIKPYQVGHGTPAQTREMVDLRVYHSSIKLDDDWYPLVTGTDVNRYTLGFDSQYIYYGKNLMYPSNEAKIKAEKILLRRTSSDLRAVVDANVFYPQNSLFIITSKYDLWYLVSLINSKLFDFVYKTKCPQVGKVFAEVKPSIIKSMPVMNISHSKQLPFINVAKKLTHLNEVLLEQSRKFHRVLKRKFNLLTLPKKLQDWYLLSFSDFIKELSKLKVTLSLSEESKWEDFFENERKKLLSLNVQITTTNGLIDKMIYDLYNLTEQDIFLIESA